MRETPNQKSVTGIPRSITGAVLLCLAMVIFQSVAAVAQPATGRTEVVLSLLPRNQPEGIAVSRDGNLFVGNRLVGETTVVNEILRIGLDGTAALFATLPESSPGAQGLLGLTVDPVGHLYAALASFDANQGVWRVSRDGTVGDRIPGSEAIGFPNALTFDPGGNLYVTDSFRGAIWRSHRGGAFSLWVENPLLAPLAEDPLGFPLPGANGIAFYPPVSLYVANTELGSIVMVRIEPDGSAGPVEVVTPPFAVPTVDGIAMDVHGQIHAVLPGFSILGVSPLVSVDPATGAVTPTVINPVDMGRFDTPLSLAFGGGRSDVGRVLVTNGDLPDVPGGPGPGVVQVDVGVPGFPIP